MEESKNGKPSLLYVTPVLPSFGGGGISMRAGVVLEALCEHYRVSALVGSLYPALEDERFVRERCNKVVILPAGSKAMDAIRLAQEAYQGDSFDTIHVFRLAGVPFAKPHFKRGDTRPALHLDLDDVESKANRRLAEVYRKAGDEVMAGRAAAQAQSSFLLEAAAFRMFDRLYVCSEFDKNQLMERCRAEIRVLQNVVRLPGEVRQPREDATFGFLFVGTLGYYPNKDAVRYFCTQVLPLIRQNATRRFVVHIVGSGYCEDLLDLNAADVRIVGRVAEVRRWYEESRVVIAPVRIGAGTRIKILEAFS